MSVLGMATGAIAGLIAVTPASGFVVLKLVKPIAGLRVRSEDEKIGLDVSQHGEMLSPN